MTPSLSNLLDAIEARVKAATQGHWSCDQCGDVWAVNVAPLSTDEGKYKAIGTTRFYSNENTDAIFIANAPTDIARLCEALRIYEKAFQDTKWNLENDLGRCGLCFFEEARDKIKKILKGEKV